MKFKKIIYLADDDEDDRQFLREAIEMLNESIKVIEAVDGQDLLNQIEAQYAQQSEILVILDMNMPKVTGMEALCSIRANPLFKHIPTVMISTSSEPSLVQEAYQTGINAYITKPTKVDGYQKIAQALQTCFMNPSTI